MSLPDTSRSLDPTEQDFLAALDRLKEGEPVNKKLKAIRKEGKLKINISNVALESGHSRTLIALKACRYPQVREAIKLAQTGKKSEPKTYTQLFDNLHATIAELKADKRLLEMNMASHVLARRRAEIKSRRDAAEAARLRRYILELEKVAHLPSQEAALPRLVLIRGLPGKGKTTMAMGFQNDGYLHHETDQFFLVDGEYRFDPNRLPEAHAWCLQQTRTALDSGECVVVANVFANLDDIKPYTELGVDYQVEEATYPGQSIHKIPAAVLRAMERSWVPLDRLLKTLQHQARKKASVTSISSKKR
jgi:hypothetical protein